MNNNKGSIGHGISLTKLNMILSSVEMSDNSHGVYGVTCNMEIINSIVARNKGSLATSGSGVHDTVVNQLSSMTDGVNSLNNVIIGMTNRKDLLNDASLRSDRLELHIEIGLPDIFRIHTKLLRDNGFLDENISISNLPKRTKNYTGAVRSAESYAMQTQIDKKLRNTRITQKSFDLALEEVMCELGKNKIDDQLSFMYNRGIIDFNDSIIAIN